MPHPTSFTHSQTSDPVEILEEYTSFNSLPPPPSFLLTFSFRYFDPTNIGRPFLFGLPNTGTFICNCREMFPSAQKCPALTP